jgi:hypothetical protein
LEATVAQGLADLLALQGVDPPVLEGLFEDEARQRLPVNVLEVGLRVVHALRQELCVLEKGDHLVWRGPPHLELAQWDVVLVQAGVDALPNALCGEGLHVAAFHRSVLLASLHGRSLLLWADFPPREARAEH